MSHSPSPSQFTGVVLLEETTPLLSPAHSQHLSPSSIVSPPKKQTILQNRNVFLSLLVVSIAGLSESMWASGVLVAFINIMTGKNAEVGYVEATQGIAQLVTALPMGYLADKYSRSVFAWRLPLF